VQALAAGRLDEGSEAQRLQPRLQRPGGGDDVVEVQTFVGIQVEGDLLGRLGIARLAAPRMQLQPA